MKMGFTLVELMVTIGIFAILATLSSVNFFSTYSQSNLGAAEDILIADLKTAQSSAMAGAGDSSWSTTTMTALPSGVNLTTTLPGNQVTFLHSSGEIAGYDSAHDSITLTSGVNTRTVELNQYGTLTGD